MLIDSNLLSTPIIYPSYYFKKHHYEYYVHLDRVRTHGDFEGWIKYYLTAIAASSNDAYNRAKDIEILEEKIQKIINTDATFNNIKETANHALSILFQFPITTATELSKHMNKSYNTANNIIQQFIKHGILVIHTSKKQRNKIYHFEAYLNLLEQEY
jgi:Fic family protein